ncbi:hypothetical protein [Lysinibacillus xylanilyticus]|uniref:hypothetical protein n=1 Tax=Lysinibacillus xylanilyticus TaxID=582475 RepID=UPI003D016316
MHLHKKAISLAEKSLFPLLKKYYGKESKMKYSFSTKRGVDFRSGWALSWGRPMSRFALLQGLICDTVI